MSAIVGIGACVMDTLMTLPEFPKEDTKMRAMDVKQSGGGPAATGIVAAAKLGVKSGFIGVLSDDSGGQFLSDDFMLYGVDVSRIDIKSGYRSFTSFIWLNKQKGSRTCVFDKGNLPPLVLSDSQKQFIKNAKLLLVDGNDMDAAVEAAEIARKSNTTVLYDAGGLYDGVERLLCLTDILIPSEEFALAHTGKTNVNAAAAVLDNWYHPKAVVITRGKKGGLLYVNGKYIEYPIYPAEVVDSNGAGDVFHGAFAAAVVRGFSLEQACHFSSAVSAIKCTGTGARESVPDYDTTIYYLRRNGYEL
ncbi:MAG: carbohydrate kinase family protein [Oscillospiraceae bacterium]|nr:carbohydrate kinase family protein [Oscillospiraceae bacterium]